MSHPLFKNADYQRIYHKLFEIAESRVTAFPFVPVVPTLWEKKSPKVVWLGGATDGWDDDANWPETFDLVTEHERSRRWLKEDFENRNMRSPFWRIQQKCLRSLGLELDDAAWSNIYKIGGRHGELRGMPPKTLRLSQADLSVSAFQLECKILKPDLVVFHVGSLADLILHRIAGPWRDWTVLYQDDKPIAAYKVFDGTSMIWMSRRVAHDDSYLKAFSSCCAQLGIYPHISEPHA